MIAVGDTNLMPPSGLPLSVVLGLQKPSMAGGLGSCGAAAWKCSSLPSPEPAGDQDTSAPGRRSVICRQVRRNDEMGQPVLRPAAHVVSATTGMIAV